MIYVNSMEYHPIARVISERTDVIDDQWGNILAKIKFDKPYDSKKFNGVSYAYFLFYMDLIEPTKIIRDARHPRNNNFFPLMGILAQRAKNRPNQIGLSCAKILQSTDQGMVVQGLDAIDATPVLCIRPVEEKIEPRRELIKEAFWLEEVMKDYFIGELPENIEERLAQLNAPQREAPHLIKIVPIGRTDPSKAKNPDERIIIFDQRELHNNALQGLDLFSHIYVIHEKPSNISELDFTIAKIENIHDFSLVLNASSLPIGSKVFDIKPYTKLFFPNFT